MTHFFKANPPKVAAKKVFTASGGFGEVTDTELIISNSRHTFVYKFESESWYQRNRVTRQDHFLGEGVSPTLELPELKKHDKNYFGEITFEPNTSEGETDVGA